LVARYLLENGWVIVRFSGTEPLLRIYAEAESLEKVQEILKGTASFLGL
jgi:phosphomannomutase